MPKEIERKFLVLDGWQKDCFEAKHCLQGFIYISKEKTIRVRVLQDKGYLTVKGATEGMTRLEYDYEIPLEDAKEMLTTLCIKPLIEKQRYYCKHKGHLWEVDVFMGANEGLVLAEIELKDPEEVFDKPSWVGQEVTDDPRYYNASLVSLPYNKWQK